MGQMLQMTLSPETVEPCANTHDTQTRIAWTTRYQMDENVAWNVQAFVHQGSQEWHTKHRCGFCIFFSKLDCGNIIPNVVIEHQIEVSCDQRIAHVHATRARAQPLCLHVLCVLYVYECGLTWQKLSSGRQCGISRSIRRVRQKPEKKWTRQPRKSGICHFFLRLPLLLCHVSGVDSMSGYRRKLTAN